MVIALFAISTSADAHPEPDHRQPPSPSDTPPCRGVLDGHVVDGITHEPIAGASVRGGARLHTVTDARGHFELRDLCDGPVQLAIERAGYLPYEWDISFPRSPSFEAELLPLDGETIIVEDEAPPADDMRSTTVLAGETLERTRGRTFTDALTGVAGVAPLRTASGVAKPIVRGQFGRRLLLLVDGVRHRAQEWGIDHAPEIDPFVADRITIVRGAAGVQFGPDAIGGAVLVEPPPLRRQPGTAGEAHLMGFANGRGGAFAGRIQQVFDRWPNLSWQFEGSVRRTAATSTPDYALDNTGLGELNLGAAVGRRGARSRTRLAYLRYQAQLGVCTCLRVDTAEELLASVARGRPLDAELYRSELAIERPYQAVVHDLALLRTERDLDGGGSLQATLAFQHNHRQELDIVRSSVTGAQFDFRLFTQEIELTYQPAPVHLSDRWHLRGRIGSLGVAQFHGYAGLPLIPDYTAGSAGTYAIGRLVGRSLEVELGVRHDLLARTAKIDEQDFARLVRSGQLASDACGDEETDPVACGSTFQSLSASLGVLRRLGDVGSLKLDLSTASRPPNPDEQYLNGTSPTFPVLGLGKPDLGVETTYSASVTASYQDATLAGEVSAYANRIDDYIYFAPAVDANGAPIFDVLIRGAFPRFVTRAIDASFYGVDAGITLAPRPWIELAGQASAVRAASTDGTYLVFVPPDRAHGTVTVRRRRLLGLGPSFLTLDGTVVRRQDRFDLAADLAPPPAAYVLLGAELGSETRVGGQPVRVALHGSNLLDVRYRDYTSLLRYFADQPGWQLMFRVSLRVAATNPS